jgi:hypothetical protein
MFGLIIGFTEQVLTVTESNCSAVANSHTQHFTMAHIKFSQPTVSSPVDVPLLPGSHQPPALLNAISRLPLII